MPNAEFRMFDVASNVKGEEVKWIRIFIQD